MFDTCADFLKCRHKTRLPIARLVKDTSTKASKKITDAKFAKDFQAVLKELQKAQRLAAKRETSHPPFVPKVVLPSRHNLLLQSIKGGE
ncbi:hypothetical protein KY284_011407 [Solanum tuberosum]|nr:hypothetical protein KY284_011407 [Solanum tuberosum]